jgi:hypothetical protein
MKLELDCRHKNYHCFIAEQTNVCTISRTSNKYVAFTYEVHKPNNTEHEAIVNFVPRQCTIPQHFQCNCYLCTKVKAIPLQASTGPESSRGLRLPDFKTIGT